MRGKPHRINPRLRPPGLQVWDVKMEKADFIRKIGTDPFVTTELLKTKYYHEFQRKVANLEHKNRILFGERAEVLLACLYNWFGLVFGRDKFEGQTPGCKGSEEIPFSISIIAETVQDVTVETLRTKSVFYSTESSRILRADCSLNLNWGIFALGLDLLISRMTKNGWCPGEVRHLLHNLKVRGQYYVSNFCRQGPVLSHGDACSDSKCALKSFDEATYKSRHQSESCSCEPL